MSSIGLYNWLFLQWRKKFRRIKSLNAFPHLSFHSGANARCILCWERIALYKRFANNLFYWEATGKHHECITLRLYKEIAILRSVVCYVLYPSIQIFTRDGERESKRESAGYCVDIRVLPWITMVSYLRSRRMLALHRFRYLCVCQCFVFLLYFCNSSAISKTLRRISHQKQCKNVHDRVKNPTYVFHSIIMLLLSDTIYRHFTASYLTYGLF